MSAPFVGEVRPWALNFAPIGWAMCQGQILPISQYTALFSLIGTYYGGNGTSNFALPDLRSRVPMKYGQDTIGNEYVIGEQAGVESVTISIVQLPVHNHPFLGTASAADVKRPVTGSAYAQSTAGDNFYAAADGNAIPINANTVQALVGSNQPHQNLQPYLAINWCIAIQGIYPARN
jgi:microcystin-dependent protein